MKLRAIVDMSLRKSADRESPLWEEWHDWKAGEVFEAPPNLKVALALKRGIAEEVTAKKGGDADG